MAPRRRRGAGSDSDRDEPTPSVNEGPKNRPPNTAFRQQRMRAWQCVLTPKLIVTVFSILAAIYLGFGAYLTYLTYTVCFAWSVSGVSQGDDTSSETDEHLLNHRFGIYKSITPTAQGMLQRVLYNRCQKT